MMIDKNFDKIYKQTVPKLKYFLKNGWNITDEDIEEIIHDVLVILNNKLLKGLFKWNKSWLYKTTYNKAIDKIRNNNKNIQNINFDEELISAYPSPEEQLLSNEQRDWIYRFINTLDDRDKQIAYLYYFEDITCRKIGVIIQMPTGTVKFRLHQIRKKIGEEYYRHEKK